MKGKQLSVVAVIALSALTLCACHKQTPAMGGAVSGSGPDTALENSSPAAKAYAMNNNQNAYQTQAQQRDANGELINSMTAPSSQTYYFNFDSNQVHSTDLAAMNVQANYLASHPNAKVRLEGNTDNRGSREYNIGLGWRRDQSVTRLLEQQGVRPGQIDMVSYGKERPVVLGDNDRAWQFNRRVHLVYEAY